MEVTIKLHGSLRRHRPDDGGGHGAFALQVAQKATVEEALSDLGVARDVVAAVAVNGEQAGLQTVLEDGDTVHIFPPAAGG
ncbi:MAG TPA: MoaD/ThiS family protein [Candidatus Binatia bacterium]|nr:MoaD/ThiS family protein [Candidatus Binatia bacterium]